MSKILKVKLLTSDAKLPTKATRGSTAYDLYASEDVTLQTYYSRCLEDGPHFKTVSTGLSLDLEMLGEGIDVQIRPRSGLAANHGVTVLNSPGTIDRDYKGELKVVLINHGLDAYHVKKGDRIAQLVFAFYLPNVVLAGMREQDPVEEAVYELSRGVGGFGSTGR